MELIYNKMNNYAIGNLKKDEKRNERRNNLYKKLCRRKFTRNDLNSLKTWAEGKVKKRGPGVKRKLYRIKYKKTLA